jgi:hypothetical protein
MQRKYGSCVLFNTTTQEIPNLDIIKAVTVVVDCNYSNTLQLAQFGNGTDAAVLSSMFSPSRGSG